MSTHSRFSPSKLPRIIGCPGSVQLCEAKQAEDRARREELGIKDTEQASSSFAEEGTYLHAIVEDHLTRDTYHVSSILHEDLKLHAEYKDAVEEVLNWVFTLKCNNPDEDSVEYIEGRSSLKSYCEEAQCGLLEDVAGTADYVYVANKTLWVPDWKFGKGVIVEAGSDQSFGYAAGVLADLERRGVEINKVVLVIGQPRIDSDRFKIFETTPSEVKRWVKHVLSPALLETEVYPPILRPSEKACRWCDVKTNCGARHSLALKSAEAVFAAHAKLPDLVTQAELSIVLDMIPQLDKYIKDLTNHAFNMITSGVDIPNYKVVHGRSIRKWKNEKLAQEVLDDYGYDISELATVKFFGPAGVEKVLRKEHKKEPFFTDLIEKPPGKLTLAVEGDKREAVVFKTAEETFKDLV